MIWQAKVYDSSISTYHLNDGFAQHYTRDIEVHYQLLPTKNDHIFEIRWTDDNGEHRKRTVLPDEEVKRKDKQNIDRWRAAGAFTEWGRIEVHYYCGQVRVFIWTGVSEMSKYEVAPVGSPHLQNLSLSKLKGDLFV